MKKLKLQLEDLAIDSFQTTAPEKPRGTVFGEQCTCNTACTCPGCPTCDATCYNSCTESCAGTCVYTCPLSCGGTCEYTCDYSCNYSCECTAEYTCATAPSPRQICVPCYG